MSRVEATFSASRKSVTTSSSDGKIENSSGCCVYMLTMRMMSASEIETARSRSTRSGGSGITMITTTATSAKGTHHLAGRRSPATAVGRAGARRRSPSATGPPGGVAAPERVDVGEDLRDRAVERGRDLGAELDGPVEGPRERAALDDRHAGAPRRVLDPLRQLAGALRDDARRAHLLGAVAERDREVDRVGEHHVGAAHLGEHPALGDLAVRALEARPDLRIALALLVLVPHLLAGHLEALLVAPALPEVVEGRRARRAPPPWRGRAGGARRR